MDVVGEMPPKATEFRPTGTLPGEFKKRNRLPYGFVVADSDANNINYGAYSIPMSFLIDRRGAVRFISVGADPDEIMAFEKMIKKLIAEPAEVRSESQ